MDRAEEKKVFEEGPGSGYTSPDAGEEEKAAEARRWLERMARRGPPDGRHLLERAHYFDGLANFRLKVVHVGAGKALCSFTVLRPLTDEDGNWLPGAMSTVVIYVCAAAAISDVGVVKAFVDLAISFFTPAKLQEEVEVEARVLCNLGRLSAVAVEIRKKRTGALVASGVQWLADVRSNTRISKL